MAARLHGYPPRNRGVEIGGTWYGLANERTAANTECKYLLLRHAFEAGGASGCSSRPTCAMCVRRRPSNGSEGERGRPAQPHGPA